MAAKIDDDGQPIVTNFNRGRRTDRDISEMLGLAKGVLADGRITEAEAHLLNDWCRAHPDVVNEWPGRVLVARLDAIFADGVVSEEERLDLKELLEQIIGGEASILGNENLTTKLPLDDPLPDVYFDNAEFVFTGKFAFGPRRVCEEQVKELGGWCKSTPGERTDFLVIGTFGSRDWIQTSYGRKIEKGVDFRERHKRLRIITEDHWAMSFGPEDEDDDDD